MGVVFPLLNNSESYRLAPVHDRVARQFEASAARAIDLLHAFRRLAKSGSHSVGMDALRPSQAGHGLAAGVIASYLAVHGFLPDVNPDAVGQLVANRHLPAALPAFDALELAPNANVR